MNLKSSENSRHEIPADRPPRIARTYGSVSGHHVLRDGTAIAFASTLERDFIVRTGFFVDVTELIPRPIVVEYVGNGSARQFEPTFLVCRRGSDECADLPKPELVDVTPQYKWRNQWPQWRPRWRAAIREANARGWKFRIQDEHRIRDAAFDNIQYLARYKRTFVDNEVSESILNDLGETGPSSVATILKRHFAPDHQTSGLRQVWALLSQRRIDCRISRPLDGTTEVWIPTIQ